MNMTNLKSNPQVYVENCCNNADVIVEREEWGVVWPDGVRKWNSGKIISCRCSKCGRSLHFEYNQD